MNKVTSADGTRIAFDRVGEGPRSSSWAVAPPIARPTPDWSTCWHRASQFSTMTGGDVATVDTAPYAVSRDYEDLEALIGAAGGSSHLYGTSGGGIIALEGVVRGLPVNKLAVWEPPYIVDELTAAADAVSAVVADAERRTLSGQPHNVDPAAIAPALTEFFLG